MLLQVGPHVAVREAGPGQTPRGGVVLTGSGANIEGVVEATACGSA